LKEWFVYVLQSLKTNQLYSGITVDIHKRLRAHNAGKGAKFTRGRGPWRVLALRAAGTQGQALRFEAYLKKLSREDRLGWCTDNLYKE
jgi:putative endonuclease